MEVTDQIYKNLEKDVDDLVNDLESKINLILKTAFSNAQSSVGNLPGTGSQDVSAQSGSNVKPNSNINKIPKWRGVRGLWRWLWKGYSPDNPDYANLHKNENYSFKTLNEYNDYLNEINNLADTIISEISINAEDPRIKGLFNLFRNNLKEKLKKYFFIVQKTKQNNPAISNVDNVSRNAVGDNDNNNNNDAENDFEDERSVIAARDDSAIDRTPDEEISDVIANSRRRRSVSKSDLITDAENNISNPQEPNVGWFTLKKKVKKEYLLKLVTWLASKNIDPSDETASKNTIKQKLNWSGDFPKLNLKSRISNLFGLSADEIGELYKKLTKEKFEFYDDESDDTFSSLDNSNLDDLERILNSDDQEGSDEAIDDQEGSDEAVDGQEGSDEAIDDQEGSDESDNENESGESKPKLEDSNFKDKFREWILKNLDNNDKLKEFGYDISDKIPEDKQIDFLNIWNQNLLSFEEKEINSNELIINLFNAIKDHVN